MSYHDTLTQAEHLFTRQLGVAGIQLLREIDGTYRLRILGEAEERRRYAEAAVERAWEEYRKRPEYG
jgi:hypothetical protein